MKNTSACRKRNVVFSGCERSLTSTSFRQRGRGRGPTDRADPSPRDLLPSRFKLSATKARKKRLRERRTRLSAFETVVVLLSVLISRTYCFYPFNHVQKAWVARAGSTHCSAEDKARTQMSCNRIGFQGVTRALRPQNRLAQPCLVSHI